MVRDLSSTRHTQHAAHVPTHAPEEDADVELGGGALEDRVGLGVGMVQSIPAVVVLVVY